jgi:hypothetical protein
MSMTISKQEDVLLFPRFGIMAKYGSLKTGGGPPGRVRQELQSWRNFRHVESINREKNKEADLFKPATL